MKTMGKIWGILSLLSILFSLFLPGVSRAITVKQEEEIAREFMKYVEMNYPVIKDAQITSYVERVGREILANYPPQPFKYTFRVIKSDVYNAFAGPGGHIFVHSGLIEAMESEEELAGIIGHEISHVSCRHISDRIERSKKIGVGTLAGIAAGIFLGVSGNPAAGSALTIGSLAGSQTVSLAYSREDEMQADRIGLKYLVEAGYGGTGLLDALKRIRDKQWFGPEEVPTYLTTHPALSDRMVYIKNWMESHRELIEKKRKSRDSYGFDRTRTRLAALYGDEEAAKKRFGALVEKEPDNLMGNYGYGLFLARSGKYKPAADYLKKVIEQRAFEVNYLKDLGAVYFKDGKYQEALDVFEGALSLDAGDYESNLFVGRIFTELGRLDEAASIFHSLESGYPGENRLNYHLGNVYAKQGNPSDSHYHLGVYYKNLHHYPNALFHLKKALETTRDKEKKAKIEGMIKKIRKKSAKADNQKNKKLCLRRPCRGPNPNIK